jgi:hypothetical protein
MRKFFSPSLIAAAFTFTLIGNAVAAETMNNGRGFLKDKCYEEISQTVCYDDHECFLMIFPQMPGQLSFMVEKIPKEIQKTKSFLKVSFKILDQEAVNAKILKWEKVNFDTARSYLQKASYLGQSIACDKF